MTKKEICEAHETCAYYAGGLTQHIFVKHIEYGIEDYMYCTTGEGTEENPYRYHKLMIHYNGENDAYVQLWGRRLRLNMFLRTNI